MTPIELDIKVEWRYDGEYIPAVINAPPEYCHPAEYPSIEIDKVMYDVTSEEIEVTSEDEQKIIDYIYKNEFGELETSFLFTFDCELDIDRTIKYNNQDITHLVEQDYINELFS